MANLVRWEDPFASMASFHSQLDNLFNNLYSAPNEHGLRSIQTSTNMDVYT